MDLKSKPKPPEGRDAAVIFLLAFLAVCVGYTAVSATAALFVWGGGVACTAALIAAVFLGMQYAKLWTNPPKK